MLVLWDVYRIQLVLAMVIIITAHRSLADFSCDFGKRHTWAGLYECGILQSGPKTWGTVSGFGSNGRGPSGGKRDGYLFTTPKNTPSVATFRLPNLNLPQNSGLLSFHCKFFDPGENTLRISVCGMISVVTLKSIGNWEKVKGIRVYCNGQAPRVDFTAIWKGSSGRIAVDNILVVSTPPPLPTTTIKATTTMKSTTTKERTIATTKHRTTITKQTTTGMTTSEWTTFSSQSTDSSTTMSAITESPITFTQPLVSIPIRLEAKRRSTQVIAVSLSVVVILLVIIVLAVVFLRTKLRSSSKTVREGQAVTMSRSLNYNRENESGNDHGNDHETALSNAYVTFPEGVNPAQQSYQGSDGDYGTEEMVVNILYQSVDK